MLFKFRFEGSLSLILYALPCLCNYLCNEKFEKVSQMLLMLIDSFSFLSVVLLENAVIIYTGRRETAKIKKKNRFQKIQVLLRQKSLGERYSLVFVILVGVLTFIISSLGYIILFLFISGFTSVYCLFNIVCAWVVLRIWFKWKMYRHHMLSIGILVIGIIISLLSPYSYYGVTLVFVFQSSYFYLISGLLGLGLVVSGREIIEKYAMDILFYGEYRLLFYEGVVSLVLNCICLGVLQAFKCKEETFELTLIPYMFCYRGQIGQLANQLIALFNFSSIDTLFVWLFFISSIIMNILRIKINKKQGPTHRYAMDLFSLCLFVIISDLTSVKYDDSPFDYVNLIVIAILFIGFLIYNENIELHFLGLAKNTKAEIQQRAKEELSTTFIAELSTEEVSPEPEANQSQQVLIEGSNDLCLGIN